MNDLLKHVLESPYKAGSLAALAGGIILAFVSLFKSTKAGKQNPTAKEVFTSERHSPYCRLMEFFAVCVSVVCLIAAITYLDKIPLYCWILIIVLISIGCFFSWKLLVWGAEKDK